jgi:hypothetical protein
MTLHYDVAWSGSQKGRIAGDGALATTTVDMALALDARVESASADEATLVLSFSRVDKHALHTLSADVFPTHEAAVAALVGPQARVRMGSNGTFRDVAFEPSVPDIFVNTLQWMIGQSGLSLDGSGSWEATERGPFGESNVHYTQDGPNITRARTKYTRFDAFANTPDANVTKLDGKSVVTLRGGHIDSLETNESVDVAGANGQVELAAHVHFDVRFRGMEPASQALRPSAFGPATPAGQPVVGRETRAQLLEQRIAGMTRARLLSDVRLMGNSGTMPSHTEWLWRATGLLEQDPSLAKDLARLALSAEATDKARALILDLFASVGHAEAQAAMRAILTSPQMAKSPSRPGLIQRVSFLSAPEPATVKMVWDGFREAKVAGARDLMTASAHALASASRKLGSNGDDAAARRIVSDLRDEIASTSSTEARVGLLSALGNASGADIASIAKPFATGEDPDVREAAAGALRKTDTPEATALLLSLAADSDEAVQASAMASLRDRTLTAEHWSYLARLVEEGRVGPPLDGAVLNLAANYLGQIPAVTRVIARIGGRQDASASTRARANAMLASVSG